MSELRKDPLLGIWVILAAVRGKRPSDFRDHSQALPQPGPCAFCPHHEYETGEELFASRDSETDCASDWRVRVVNNKFPAVTMNAEHPNIEVDGPFQDCSMAGFGSHEVVIETPEHDTKFACLPVSNVAEVLKVFRHRILHFRGDKRLKFVQVFKNQGDAAGASMRHSHSQIITLPIIPPNVQQEMDCAKSYYDTTGKCLLCEIVEDDLRDGKRLIASTPAFAVIAPYAPRFPYETWIVPRAHASKYEDASDLQLQSLASVLLSTLRRMDHAFHKPPYNYTLHTSPLQEHCNEPYYHWSIRIVPHLIKFGGFELGSGCLINPVFPEKAAEALRDIDLCCSETCHESSGN